MDCPHCGQAKGLLKNRDWNNVHGQCPYNDCVRERRQCKNPKCGQIWTQWSCENYRY